MAIMCSYFWCSFPFDNLCSTDIVDEEYIGTFRLTPFEPSTGSMYLSGNETAIGAKASTATGGNLLP